MARYQTDTFTSSSVTAGASLQINRTSLPNYANIVKTKVVPDSGGGSFDFKVYKKDAFNAADLLAWWDNVTTLYDPMDNSSGTPAEAEEGNPIPYEDEDGTSEFHLLVTNNDTVSHTYTVTILYEEVPLMSSAGAMTLRAGLTATTGAFSSTISGTTITATTAFRAADGSVGTPSVSFTNDTGLGFYRSGSGNLDLAYGGAGIAHWDSAKWLLPSASTLTWNNDVILLRDAANVLALKNGTTAQALRIYGSTTGPKYLLLSHDGSNGGVGTIDDGPIYITTNNTARWGFGASPQGYDLYPNSDNSYGIGGASNRVADIHVGGFVAVGTNPATVGTGRYQNATYSYWRNAANNDNLRILGVTAGNEIQFGDNSNTSGLFIDAGNEIVVNNAGGDTNFVVKSDTNASAFVVDAGAFGGVGAVGIGALDISVVDVAIRPPARTANANVPHALFGVTGNNGAVTIPAGTSAWVATAYFEEPNIAATGTVTVASTLYIAGAPTEGASNYAEYIVSGAVRWGGYGAGAATFDGSGNITSVSDERLKDLQGPYSAGLAEIMQINPILYKWKPGHNMETEHTYAGFSAQNVDAALPIYGTGRDAEGYYSLQDRAVIAALVNSVKELNAKLEGRA